MRQCVMVVAVTVLVFAALSVGGSMAKCDDSSSKQGVGHATGKESAGEHGARPEQDKQNRKPASKTVPLGLPIDEATFRKLKEAAERADTTPADPKAQSDEK
jgi:hypothetical protein